jgi:hypothetical protein
MKDKSFWVMVVILPISFILILILGYFSTGWIPEITAKKYDKKPDWSPAPAFLTSNNVDHVETSGACWDTENYKKHDYYFINQPAEDVEVYYQREMEKYCPNDQGQNVTFSMRSCLTREGRMHDCRQASCYLRDETPSLSEYFYIEIIPISPSTTLVQQNQDMWYLTKYPQHVQCGE